MLPLERASLRTAILVTLGIYALLFAAVELWNPLGNRHAAASAIGRDSNIGRSQTRLSVRIVSLAGPSPGVPSTPATIPDSPASRSPSAAAATSAHEAAGVTRARAKSPTASARPAVPLTSTRAPAATSSAPTPAPRTSAPASAPPASTRTPAPAASTRATSGAASPLAGPAVLASGDPSLAAGGLLPGSQRKAGAAGSSSAGEHPNAADPSAILALIRGRIESSRVYPMAARVKDIQGSVKLQAAIGPDGRLTGSRVIASSGSTILDRAGLALLSRVFPIPNTLGYAFTVDVTVAYRLTDAATN